VLVALAALATLAALALLLLLLLLLLLHLQRPVQGLVLGLVEQGLVELLPLLLKRLPN
jgi:hypothetical protein